MNRIKATAYKVLYKANPKSSLLYSQNKAIREAGFGITYRKGKIIRPELGELFVFLDKSYAISWKGVSDKEQVWEVEAYGLKAASHYVLSDSVFNLQKWMQKYWEVNGQVWDPEYVRQGCVSFSPPISTAFCRSLKLIKRVN